MISGKQNILSWAETKMQSGFPYFTLFHQGQSSSGQWVNKSPDDENYSAERAYNDLATALSTHVGKFTLCLNDKPGISPKGMFKEDIQLSFEDKTAALLQPAVVNGVSDDEVTRRIDAALVKYKTEQELAQLRAENAELKKKVEELEDEGNNPLSRIAGVIEPFIPHILNAQVAKVAGLPKHETAMPNNDHLVNEDVETRLGNVIAIFEKAAPEEWLSLLEKLAAKVESNPAIINNLKMFL